MGTALGLLGAGVVVATGAIWMQLIRQVRVPRNRTPYLLCFGLGALLGLLALATGPGWVGGIAGGFALLAGSMMPALRLLSSQERPEPAPTVGGPILEFTAPDENGQPFELASLSGQPFLLKFFRGHW